MEVNSKVVCNWRTRTSLALKAQNVRKPNKKVFLLGCSRSVVKKRITYQLSGGMTRENEGSVWSIDHCIPIASFNVVDENKMIKCFG